jgi:selenocysteine-specific elongation factor
VRSFIVGTAGHIDHGKSALVLALTGTDPDRLKEEKERGITIDIGFAHLDLGGGLVASFIDVPGHERFVRNMLAGAHGIDAVILVVAADESVMPQTREHFHICRLLGIRRGLVALTKCDAADADSQAIAEMEARELAAGSFLDGAPVLRVSARTGQGLDELRSALEGLAASLPPRPSDGLLRLPVDRTFSLRGFGTVVTGTLVSGAVEAGEELEVLPSRKRARARGLQVHGAAVERAPAGTRVAVNLAGLEVEDVARGDVLARPDTLLPTSMVDVELALLPGERPLADQTRVRVHLASAEALARVRTLGGDRIEPGAAGLAQLRLERPVAAGRGDRLILRSYSPPATIGGGVVLDPLPPKRRRGDRPAVERLRALAGDDVAGAAAALVEDAGGAGIAAPRLAARLTLPLPTLLSALAAQPAVVAVGKAPGALVARTALSALADSVTSLLARVHRQEPLKAALSREELRRRLFSRAPAGAFEHVLEALAAAGKVRATPEAVALAGHAVTLTAAEEDARRALLAAVREAGLVGVDPTRAAEAIGKDRALLERVSRVLLAEGAVRRLGEGLLVHRDHLEALKQEVRRRWPPGSRLDVAGFKELTGLTRKYVIPLLEYLDGERVTRRAGGDRLVLM